MSGRDAVLHCESLNLDLALGAVYNLVEAESDASETVQAANDT